MKTCRGAPRQRTRVKMQTGFRRQFAHGRSPTLHSRIGVPFASGCKMVSKITTQGLGRVALQFKFLRSGFAREFYSVTFERIGTGIQCGPPLAPRHRPQAARDEDAGASKLLRLSGHLDLAELPAGSTGLRINRLDRCKKLLMLGSSVLGRIANEATRFRHACRRGGDMAVDGQGSAATQ